MILDKYMDIINSDYPLYSDVIDLVKSNEYDVMYESDNTLILRGHAFPYYVDVTRNVNECLEQFKKLDVHVLICRNVEIYEYYKSLDFECNPCYQVCYKGGLDLDVTSYDIRKPNIEDMDLISKCYPHGDKEYLLSCREDNRLFGLYIDNKLKGFIGVHDEGSSGMLHIMEDARGNGYAQVLEKFIFDNRLKLGRVPYGQVIVYNKESISLQEKMNLDISKGKIYWMWEKENNNK